MSAIPSAVAHTVLKNFMIISGTAVGSIYAVYQVFNIATRKEMAVEDRGQLKKYNKIVHPEQDRLDTIFDRTKIMHQVKEKKPWNMTFAEKEAAKRHT